MRSTSLATTQALPLEAGTAVIELAASLIPFTSTGGKGIARPRVSPTHEGVKHGACISGTRAAPSGLRPLSGPTRANVA